MTRKQFEAIQPRNYGEEIGKFDSLIILPSRQLHESGYRVMAYIATRRNEPLCRLSGQSDVLHINGIMGTGLFKDEFPQQIKPELWMIDCLRKSGLLRLSCRKPLTVGLDISSFEVFAHDQSRHQEP